jgi:hypothetical protein
MFLTTLPIVCPRFLMVLTLTSMVLERFASYSGLLVLWVVLPVIDLS